MPVSRQKNGTRKPSEPLRGRGLVTFVEDTDYNTVRAEYGGKKYYFLCFGDGGTDLFTKKQLKALSYGQKVKKRFPLHYLDESVNPEKCESYSYRDPKLESKW